MLRAAAKNTPDVAVLIDPADYAGCWPNCAPAASGATTKFAPGEKGLRPHRALRRGDRQLPGGSSRARARRRARDVPGGLHAAVREAQDLRYGENPHQQAAFYRDAGARRRRSPAVSSCRARSCRTTTSPTPMPPGNASRPSKAGLRHRQARQPLRRGGRSERAGGLHQGLKTDPTRPSAASWRFNRALDAAGPRERSRAPFVEVVDRASIAGGARRCWPPNRTCACSTVPLRDPRQPDRLQARRRRPAGADAGRRRTSARPNCGW